MFKKVLVFTDLDGSLLDHFTYSYLAAAPLLELFQEKGVPVIPVTSKTRAELKVLRSELENSHPFVVENGAAVFIPQGYFSATPSGCEPLDGYDCYQFSKSRQVWINLLSEMEDEFEGEFETFASLGVDGIVRLTGLSEEAAKLANQREYSEPVMWKGSNERKSLFVEALKSSGATVLQGGRFLHVTGHCDKGRALQWLCKRYKNDSPAESFLTIAAGDSYNDREMLEVADCALAIRSPVHDFPDIKHSNIYRSMHLGPQGWVEGMRKFLSTEETSIDVDIIDYLQNKLRS